MAQATRILTDGRLDYTCTADTLKFSNGSRICSLPAGNVAGLRGYTAQCVICDECNFIPNLKDVLQAIAPTLTRCPDASLIFASTPSGKNSYGWNVYNEALDDDSFYVQTTTIHDALQGGLNIDLDALHELCPDPDVFRQEYECEWSKELDSFLPLEALDFVDEVPSGGERWLGFDIARVKDNSVILILKKVQDVFYVEDVIVLRKTEYEKQLEVLASTWRKYLPRGGYLDSNGLGGPIAEFAQKKIDFRLKGFTQTATSKPRIYEDVRAQAFGHKLKIPERFREVLVPDVLGCTRVVTDDGKVRFTSRRGDSGHGDALNALCLSLACARDNPVNVSAPVPFGMTSLFGAPRRQFIGT